MRQNGKSRTRHNAVCEVERSSTAARFSLARRAFGDEHEKPAGCLVEWWPRVRFSARATSGCEGRSPSKSAEGAMAAKLPGAASERAKRGAKRPSGGAGGPGPGRTEGAKRRAGRLGPPGRGSTGAGPRGGGPGVAGGGLAPPFFMVPFYLWLFIALFPSQHCRAPCRGHGHCFVPGAAAGVAH